MQVTSTGSATTTPTSSSTAAAASTATAQAATVDYNSFLQLLVEELKDQDPTAPSDPTTFMAQLASFSSVEQQVQTNTKLDSLLTTNALSQAETVIGKTVTSADGKTSGQVASVALASDGTTTATLVGGTTMTLGGGVTVSDPASAS